jgi:hypothetical protein
MSDKNVIPWPEVNSGQQEPVADILAMTLGRIEQQAGVCGDENARREIQNAAGSYKQSRHELVRALAAYKLVVSGEASWTQVVRAVANYIGASERNVSRIVAAYEQTSELPAEQCEQEQSAVVTAPKRGVKENQHRFRPVQGSSRPPRA